MNRLTGIAVSALALACATSASATIITYDVNMNFDPAVIDGPSGVGTITGTFSINTTTLALTNIDLTEATNSSVTFGGAFGTQTFKSLTYDNSSIASASTGQQADKFGGEPFLFVTIQSTCCDVDGTQVGPGFQFDFPTLGGAVQPGNFDSATFESNFLDGDVKVADVPEPSSWALMIAGVGMVGAAMRTRRRERAVAAVA